MDSPKQRTKNNEQRTPQANNQHRRQTKNKKQRTTNNEHRRQTTNTAGKQRTPQANKKQRTTNKEQRTKNNALPTLHHPRPFSLRPQAPRDLAIPRPADFICPQGLRGQVQTNRSINDYAPILSIITHYYLLLTVIRAY